MDSRQRAVLLVAILASFVSFLDGSIVNVALPAITDELGGGVVTQQWTLDAYLLTLGSLILLAGAISDSFGRVRVLFVGLIGFGAASLACAIAPTAGFLIGARGVQGFAAALLVPSSLALITSTFSGVAQAKAIGRWTAWTGVSFIAGPTLGGVLVDTIGWRWIFAINVVPILVTLFFLRRVHDPARTSAPNRIDVVGAVLVALGLGGPVFALIEQGRLGWDSPAVFLPLIVGLLCFAGYLVWERRAAHPMLPLELFSVRNFAFGNIATAFIYSALSLGPLVVTLFVQQVIGLSAIQAGLISLPVALISLFVAGPIGTLAGRYGSRIFMTVGPLIATAGFLVMLTVREPFNVWLQLLPGMLLFGLGLSITVSPLTAAVLGSIEPAHSGIASAVNNAVSRVAGLIAVAFVGTIVGGQLGYDGFHRVVLVAAALMALGAVASFIGIRRAQPTALPTVESSPGTASSGTGTSSADSSAAPATGTA
ncbi:MFS transporter [Naasia lichenicola]|uniref:MFS transporter n=1 Tax=Naasia lichenicola TaxID=2565933 RepID=A0A4S4FS18_9MICO|nr:MFS transporter [Naasia lichenicola]THG33174.1 MFS transporter [Naasia lichenicola]